MGMPWHELVRPKSRRDRHNCRTWWYERRYGITMNSHGLSRFCNAILEAIKQNVSTKEVTCIYIYIYIYIYILWYNIYIYNIHVYVYTQSIHAHGKHISHISTQGIHLHLAENSSCRHTLARKKTAGGQRWDVRCWPSQRWVLKLRNRFYLRTSYHMLWASGALYAAWTGGVIHSKPTSKRLWHWVGVLGAPSLNSKFFESVSWYMWKSQSHSHRLSWALHLMILDRYCDTVDC